MLAESHIALTKATAFISGSLVAAGYGGVVLADAITKDSSVSLEAACIVGSCAVVVAMYLSNIKRDVRELRGDVAKIKAHINHCKFAKPDVDIEQ
jgi:ethanolamine transporter EutH